MSFRHPSANMSPQKSSRDDGRTEGPVSCFSMCPYGWLIFIRTPKRPCCKCKKREKRVRVWVTGSLRDAQRMLGVLIIMLLEINSAQQELYSHWGLWERWWKRRRSLSIWEWLLATDWTWRLFTEGDEQTVSSGSSDPSLFSYQSVGASAIFFAAVCPPSCL